MKRNLQLSILFSFSMVLVACSNQGPSEDDPDPKKIVFLVGEVEHLTKTTLPPFAEQHLDSTKYSVEFVHVDPDDPNNFPGISALNDADLLFLSVRRRTPPNDQMDILETYFDSGKPIVAIRTSNHAFDLSRGDAPDGHREFKDIDRILFDHDYEGLFSKSLIPLIVSNDSAMVHPVMQETNFEAYDGGGGLYKLRNLGTNTETLLWGELLVNDVLEREPVAWTNIRDGQKIFYTALGHPSDFDQAFFPKFLVNAIEWSLEE